MRRSISFFVAALSLAIMVAIRLWDPFPVAALREAYFDVLQRLSPRVHEPLPIRVVDVDERALAQLGQWPWPRDTMADLLDQLRELGAAVVVFDILFAERDRMSPARLVQIPSIRDAIGDSAALERLAAIDSDARFAEAMTKIPVVLGISEAGTEGGKPLAPLGGHVEYGVGARDWLHRLDSSTSLVDDLHGATAGLGIVNVSPFALDRTVREVPLVWNSDAGLHNTLSVEALRVAFGETTTILFPHEAGGLEGIALADIEIPTSEEGTFRVYYREDVSDLFISAADILDPDLTEELVPWVDGHIVFIGTSAAGLLDIHATALGTNIPGVAIHAQVMEQILTGAFLERSDFSDAIEILELVAIGMLIAALLNFVGPVASIGLGFVAFGVLVWSSWIGFSNSAILVDVTYPFLGGFLTFSILAFLQYAYADQERRAIRRSFSKYVSGHVLAEIERQHHQLKLGGEIRETTVMFSDIRNFTPLSETMSPEDLVALLNDLFSDLTDDILAEGGTIDKYIGDSIMAFWNAPLEVKEHPAAAMRAALAMRRTLQRFNAEREEKGLPTIGMSVGLATGPACVGNIGSRERYNYSVIGDTVNVAARVESSSRGIGYDLVVTDATAKAVAGFATLPAGQISLKGVSQPVPLHILVGDQDTAHLEDFQNLSQNHAVAVDLLTARKYAPCEAMSEVAVGIEPGLRSFYAVLNDRRDSFSDA